MLVSSTTFIHKFMRFELIMRKFYPIIALMSIAMMTIISIPVEASETSWVVKSGQTKNFTGNYANHSKEAWVENSGTISIYNAEFRNNKLTTPNSKNKNYSTIYNNSGTISYIRKTVFSGNQTYTNGGAISSVVGSIEKIVGTMTYTGTDYISDVSFTENESKYGGAIWNNKSSRIGEIDGVLFKENTARSNGGAIFNTGTMKSIKDTVFKHNSAGTADNSKSAGYGGAIYTTKSLTIRNSTFIDNSVSRNGGAIAQMGGDLTIVAQGTGKNVLFMKNKIGLYDTYEPDYNDIYMGGKNQALYLYAEDTDNKIVLDGGITLANATNIFVNKSITNTTTSNNGMGSVYINGDVGNSSKRANLYLYGGSLSLSNKNTQAYDENSVRINTLWANKVTLYDDVHLTFDVLLQNFGSIDESQYDRIVLNSISGNGRFILTEDSFNVSVGNNLDVSFNSPLNLITTNANINPYILMLDDKGQSTKVLYMFDKNNKPQYKIRLATNGTVIFSNPYYIDEITNPLAYAVNYPNTLDNADSDGVGIVSPPLTLNKNITINSWEDYPDEEKNLKPRNKLISEALYIYNRLQQFDLHQVLHPHSTYRPLLHQIYHIRNHHKLL